MLCLLATSAIETYAWERMHCFFDSSSEVLGRPCSCLLKLRVEPVHRSIVPLTAPEFGHCLKRCGFVPLSLVRTISLILSGLSGRNCCVFLCTGLHSSDLDAKVGA